MCFLPTKYEALLVIEACLSGPLSVCKLGHGCLKLSVKSSDVYVFELDDPKAELDNPKAPLVDDNCAWIHEDYDGTFYISESNGDGLLRKEMDVTVDRRFLRLVSYYNLWHTVVGYLVPPVCRGFKNIQLRDELIRMKVLYSHSPMEAFRMKMQAAGPERTQFLRNIIFLFVVWTSQDYYPKLQAIKQGDRFPIIHSNRSYWETMSRQREFEGKSADQLKFQTEALLYRLLSISIGEDPTTATTKVERLAPMPSFTPLQNVCLYCAAFGVLATPLGAFQPIDIAKVEIGIQHFGLVTTGTARADEIASWDYFLRNYLPIDCLRNENSIPPSFSTMLTQMSTRDRESVQLGIALLYEQFPSLAKPELQDFVLLHQYHHCSSEDVDKLIQCWGQTKEGKTIRCQLLEAFQDPLQPLYLALLISNFLVLWTVSGRHEEESSPHLLPGLPGFKKYLSDPEIIEEDYALLNSVLSSFYDALRSSQDQEYGLAMAFLQKAAYIGYGRDDDLYAYFKWRLIGKSHQEAMMDMDMSFVIQRLLSWRGSLGE